MTETPETIAAAPGTLVQAVEVWRPDGEELVLKNGAYGERHDAEHRKDRRCRIGEGLVGAAWQAGVPVIRHPGEDAADDFHPLPVSRAVAIPSMRNNSTDGTRECRGVLTLLFDEAADRQGAVEVWRPNERSELALAESWYANLERFGLVSGFVKFPRRAGLPGKVWCDRFPRVMGDLGESQSFVRVAGAKAEGLSTAIGVPFMKNALELEAVLLLLSASKSPLARVMEVWAPELETKLLKIVSADYGPYVDLAPTSRRRRLRPGEGIAGRVFQNQAPCVTSDLLGVEFPLGEKLREYGFEWGAGLPVFVGGELFAVVTLLA